MLLLLLGLLLLVPAGCRRAASVVVDEPGQSRFGPGGFDRLTRTQLTREDIRIDFTGLGVQAPMFDGHTAEPLQGRDLFQAMREAEVVLLGETHLDPAAHRLQTRLAAEALATGEGALSLEMLSRPDQPVLDRARVRQSSRALPPAALEEALRETNLIRWEGWEQHYLPAIHVAMAQGLPVIAANAEQIYVDVARARGHEYLRELNPEQKIHFSLPPEDVDFAEYRQRFEEAMQGHPDSRTQPDEAETSPPTRPSREQMRAHQTTRQRTARPATQAATTRSATQSTMPSTTQGAAQPLDTTPTRDPDSIDAFFDAQLVWDATMAESILHARRQYGKPVVHLVGSFHTDFEGGLTTLLRERNLQVLTVSFVPEAGSRLRPQDLGRADVVIYTGAAIEAVTDENAAAKEPETRPVARKPAVAGEGAAAPSTVPTRPATTQPTGR